MLVASFLPLACYSIFPSLLLFRNLCPWEIESHNLIIEEILTHLFPVTFKHVMPSWSHCLPELGAGWLAQMHQTAQVSFWIRKKACFLRTSLNLLVPGPAEIWRFPAWDVMTMRPTETATYRTSVAIAPPVPSCLSKCYLNLWDLLEHCIFITLHFMKIAFSISWLL